MGRARFPETSADIQPTAERSTHDELSFESRAVTNEEDGVKGRTNGFRVTTQTALDRYKVRNMIAWRQWRAGDQLRHDWQGAGLEPKLTPNYSPAATGGGNERGTVPASERMAIARSEWRAAVQAVGKRLSSVVIAVCCQDESAEMWAKRSGASPRQASIVGLTSLRLGLDVLADHYKF